MKKLISLLVLTATLCVTSQAAAVFNTVVPGNLNVLPGNKVGIGTTNVPTTGLTVVNTVSTDPRGVSTYQISATPDNLGAQFNGFKARGTENAPTIITTGDGGSIFNAWFYDGANYLKSARISLDSVGTIAATRTPSEINLWTSTDAAPSVLTKRWTVDNAGQFISTGAQTITTTTGALTLGTGGANGNVKVTPNGSGRFNITGGNVQINNSGGNRFIVSEETATGTGAYILQSGSGSTGDGAGLFLAAAANATYPGVSWLGYTGTGSIRFGLGGTGPSAGTEQMRFTSTGNLLIGGTSETGLTGGGGLRVASTTEGTSSAASGVFDGGLLVKKAIIGTSTTAATSSTTGSLIVGNGTAATTVGIGGGALFTGGDATIGASSGNVNLTLETSGANIARNINFTKGGVLRWIIRTTGNETGANAGSSMAFTAYDDAGVAIDSPILITRTGTIATARTIANASTTDSSSVSTGSINTAGGIGITKAAFIGTTLNVAGDVQFAKTITASGTTGAQTINKSMGAVNFAGGASTLVVTDSLVTANSVIQCTMGTADATASRLSAVPTAGSFTITFGVAPTAETRVYFNVFN